MADQNKAELEAKARHAVAEQISQRVAMWVTLANGVGFAATANAFMDKDKAAFAALLLPACWAFAIGLVAGAIFNMALAYQHRTFARAWLAKDDETAKAELKNVENNNILVIGAFLMSNFSFLAGLFYPLAAITIQRCL